MQVVLSFFNVTKSLAASYCSLQGCNVCVPSRRQLPWLKTQSLMRYKMSMSCIVDWLFTEKIHIEKWRVVIRCDIMGAVEFRSSSSVRHGERLSADRPVLRRVPARLDWSASTSASRLPSRDLRPAGRVLACRRRSPANLPRDPHVPDAQEHGLPSADGHGDRGRQRQLWICSGHGVTLVHRMRLQTA